MHDKILINSSLISSLTNESGYKPNVCPKHIKVKYIDLDQSCQRTSDAMTGGLNFESLAIGFSAKDHEIKLPRLKNGEYSAESKRILEQVQIFKLLSKEKKMMVNEFNVQVKMYKQLKEFPNVIIFGTMDIAPTMFEYEGVNQLAIVDLKLTDSLESTFSEFAWRPKLDFLKAKNKSLFNDDKEYLKTPNELSFIQPWLYLELTKEVDFELNEKYGGNQYLPQLFSEETKAYRDRGGMKFYYWVFSKNKNYSNEMAEVPYDTTDRKELLERIRLTYEKMNEYKDKGYPTNGVFEACRHCTLSCKDRVTTETVNRPIERRINFSDSDPF